MMEENDNLVKFRQSSKRYVVLNLLSTLIIVASLTYGTFKLFHLESALQMSGPAGTRIIVADFVNASPDSLLDFAVRSLIIPDLEITEKVHALTPDEVKDIMRRARIDPNRHIGNELADTLALFSGDISAVLTGSIVQDESSILVQLSMRDIGTGKDYSWKYRSKPMESRGVFLDSLGSRFKDISAKWVDSLPELQFWTPHLWIRYHVTTSSLPALKSYRQAFDDLERNNLAEAEILAKDAIANDPAFAMAYGIRARIALLNGNADSAGSYCRQALALSNDITETERLWLQGGNAFIDGQYDKAIEYYLQLLSLCKNDFWAHRDLVQCYLIHGDVKKARGHLELAMTIYPDNPWLLDARIRVELFHGGSVERADNYYEQTRDSKSEIDDATLQTFKPFIAWIEGRADDADSGYRKVLDSARTLPCTTYVAIQISYANLKLYMGNFDAALELAKEGIDYANTRNDLRSSAMAQTQRAIIDYKLGDNKDFDSLMLNLMRAQSGKFVVGAAGLLAYYQALAGRSDVADIFLRTLKSGASNSAEMAAFTYLIEGAKAQAAGDYRTAIQNYFTITMIFSSLDPGQRLFYFQPIWAYEALAEAFERNTQYEDAISAWLTIIDSKIPVLVSYPAGSFTWVMAHYRVGCLYEQMNNPQEAIRYLDEFLMLWPNPDRPLPEIEDAKRRLENLRRA